MLQPVEALPHIGRLYTVKEAADVLGLSQNSVRNFVAQGRIGCVRLGAAVRIPQSELYRVTSQGWAPPVTTR